MDSSPTSRSYTKTFTLPQWGALLVTAAEEGQAGTLPALLLGRTLSAGRKGVVAAMKEIALEMGILTPGQELMLLNHRKSSPGTSEIWKMICTQMPGSDHGSGCRYLKPSDIKLKRTKPNDPKDTYPMQYYICAIIDSHSTAEPEKNNSFTARAVTNKFISFWTVSGFGV